MTNTEIEEKFKEILRQIFVFWVDGITIFWRSFIDRSSQAFQIDYLILNGIIPFSGVWFAIFGTAVLFAAEDSRSYFSDSTRLLLLREAAALVPLDKKMHQHVICLDDAVRVFIQVIVEDTYKLWLSPPSEWTVAMNIKHRIGFWNTLAKLLRLDAVGFFLKRLKSIANQLVILNAQIWSAIAVLTILFVLWRGIRDGAWKSTFKLALKQTNPFVRDDKLGLKRSRVAPHALKS